MSYALGPLLCAISEDAYRLDAQSSHYCYHSRSSPVRFTMPTQLRSLGRKLTSGVRLLGDRAI